MLKTLPSYHAYIYIILFCWLLVLAPHGDQSELLRCFVVVSASCAKMPDLFQLQATGRINPGPSSSPCEWSRHFQGVCAIPVLFLHLQGTNIDTMSGQLMAKRKHMCSWSWLVLRQTPSMHSPDHALLKNGHLTCQSPPGQLTQKIKGWIFKSSRRPSAAIHSPCRLWRGQLLIDLKQFLQRYRHCRSAWSSRQVLRLGHHLRRPPDEQRGKVSRVHVEGYSWEYIFVIMTQS